MRVRVHRYGKHGDKCGVCGTRIRVDAARVEVEKPHAILHFRCFGNVMYHGRPELSNEQIDNVIRNIFTRNRGKWEEI